MSNKTSDKNVANDSVIAHKFATMQQQIDKKDKRIQELEEENKRKDKFIKMAKEVVENSILKQVIIDLIENETIDISGFECIAVEDLQELLEGERK